VSVPKKPRGLVEKGRRTYVNPPTEGRSLRKNAVPFITVKGKREGRGGHEFGA